MRERFDELIPAEQLSPLQVDPGLIQFLKLNARSNLFAGYA